MPLSGPRRPRTKRLLAALCASALLLPATLPPAWAQNNSLPALGDSATEDFTVGAERKLGEQIMREIRRDPDYLDDPLLLEYVQGIFQPLVTAARQRGEITPDIDERFAWEPFLIRDRNVNAFALPGGYIGVYMGMIALTSTRDELASVLAHEMSHVTQRHIARKMTNGKQQSLLGMAAMILGVLAASRGHNGDAANAVLTGGQAAAMQGELNFSREVEREADRIGFAVMTTAGYAPDGMASMFEKLDHSSNLNDSGGFPYLRTHPLTTERIGEARSRMGTAAPVRRVGLLEHTVAQARARVLMDPRVDALRRWQAMDSDRAAVTPADKLLAAYASALASSQLRDWSRADAATQTALNLTQGEPRAARAVKLMQVQSLLDRGDAAAAMKALDPYTADASRPVLILSAQAALRAAPAGAGDDAAIKRGAEGLQTWVATHTSDATAWAVLGQAWDRLGQPLRALRAEAESRLALGDMVGALDRLRAGQRRARTGTSVDFIEVSVIDARVRDIEAQRRALTPEERAEQR